MQRHAKITSKGQVKVTLPLDIRRHLGVRPGDQIVFETAGAGVRVRPVRAQSPFAPYKGIGNPGLCSGRKAVVNWLRQLRGR